MSDVESLFAAAWKTHGLAGSELVPEFAFDGIRKWKADFHIPGLIPILIELEGFGGRHQTYSGYRADCEKYNQAMAMGYVVFRLMSGEVRKDPEAAAAHVAELICQLYQARLKSR